MGQYFTPYTKRRKQKRLWGQSKDYAKTRNFKHYNGVKLMEHSYYGNRLIDAVSDYIYKNPTVIAWLGDYSDEWNSLKRKKIGFHNYETKQFSSLGKWIVNHTKKIGFRMEWNIVEKTIHPLPLITACGNGRGLGDYYGINMDLCGVWAYDVISIEDELPKGYIKTEQPDFEERE